MSMGERDRLLLDLREQAFGTSLNATTKCPACGERLEMNFDVSEVRVEGSPKAGTPFYFNRDNYAVSFRIPDSLDAVALEPQADIGQNRKHLLRRCVLRASRDAMDISADDLPDDIVEGIAAQMAEADPQSDILIALVCPHCEHQWQVPLDVVAFFWAELNSWAVRLLREIHTLASAYGWREADILALSPKRRGLYLEMICQ
jgi:hypothetical protein